MSKGDSGLFDPISHRPPNQGPRPPIKKPINGVDYNTAGSNSVSDVDFVTTTMDIHNVPMNGLSDSVSRNFRDGNLDSERYYDHEGNAYLDIDYTNHGNPKTHPHVPHEHGIHFGKDGTPRRGKESSIK